MRYLAFLALFCLLGCDWFASPAPAPADVPAILTQTAALHALSTARAEAFPPTATPPPPATQTALAASQAAIAATNTAAFAEMAVMDAEATVTIRALYAESTAIAIATQTANAPISATLTALPAP